MPSLPHQQQEQQQQQEEECHVLPCKVDYSGKVCDYAYFHPQPLLVPGGGAFDESGGRSSSIGGELKEVDSSRTSEFRAVQFRGRGLISYNDAGAGAEEKSNNDDENDLNNKLHGRLLKVRKDNKSKNGGKKDVIVVGSFQRMTEWHHEHVPSRVKEKVMQQQRGGGGQRRQHTSSATTGGAGEAQRVAQEWCQIAAVLHNPIPVAEDDVDI